MIVWSSYRFYGQQLYVFKIVTLQILAMKGEGRLQIWGEGCCAEIQNIPARDMSVTPPLSHLGPLVCGRLLWRVGRGCGIFWQQPCFS